MPTADPPGSRKVGVNSVGEVVAGKIPGLSEKQTLDILARIAILFKPENS